MSEQPKYTTELDEYDIDLHKHVHHGGSGKDRSKREAREHTNHHDPSGHNRKVVTKLMNNEKNNKKQH